MTHFNRSQTARFNPFSWLRGRRLPDARVVDLYLTEA